MIKKLLPSIVFSRAAISVFFISALNQLIALGILMMLARLMIPQDFGLFSVTMAILTIAALPFRGGFPLYVMQHVASAPPGEVTGLLKRWCWLIPLFAAIVGIILAGSFYQTHAISDAAPMMVAPLYLGAVAMVMFSGAVQRGFLHLIRSRMTELLLQPVMLMGLVGVYFIAGEPLSALGAMALQVVTFMVAALLALSMMRKVIPASLSNHTPQYDDRRWLGVALPMLLGMGLITINAAVDVVMVGYVMGDDQAGPYRLAAQLATFLVFFLAVSNNATQAHVAKLYAESKPDALQRLLTRSVRWTFALSVIPALIFMLWPASVITFFFGSMYASAASSLIILSLAALFNIGTGQSAQLLLLAGHGKEVSRVVALSLALNILLNLILLPRLGMAGAAVATAVSVITWKGWVTYRAALLTGLHTALWYWPRKEDQTSPGTQNDNSDRAMPIQQERDR